MTNKELIKYEKIMNLPSKERYIHSIKQFVAHSKLWSLYDNGWALASEGKHSTFLLWPDSYYARECSKEEWENYTPKEISLDDFLEFYLPDLEEKKFLISVFMNKNQEGIVVTPKDFLEHIEFEINKY